MSEPTESVSAGAAKAARNRSNIILFVVMAAIVGGLIAYKHFKNKKAENAVAAATAGAPQQQAADIAPPPNVDFAAGAENTNSEVTQTLEQVSDQQAQDAAASGESYVPPQPQVEPTKEELKEAEADSDSQPKEERRLTREEQYEQEHGYSQEKWDNVNSYAARIIDKRAGNSGEAGAIPLVAWNYYDAKAQQQNSANNNTSSATAPEYAEQEKVGIGAGTVWMAKLDTLIDNYLPGKVKAVLTSGPYAGGLVMGNPTVAEYEYQQVLFDTLIYKNKSYAINAVMVDMETQALGIKADVDNRYFERILFPTAASVIGSYAETAGRGETTTVTNGAVVVTQPQLTDRQRAEVALGTGVKDGAVPVLQEEGSRIRAHVTLKKGTLIGVQLNEDI